MNVNTDLDASALFDADGFLIDPSLWSESLADHIAQADGMGSLNATQLGVLHTLRREFARHGTITALSHVCHLAGREADCMHHLFRDAREAWRLAGLPNPGEEAKVYL